MPFVDRMTFYVRFRDVKYTQRFTPKPSEGTLMAKRNRRLAIIEGGRAKRKIYVRYKKLSGETKLYFLEPYSLRYRKLKDGWRKVLYAYHFDKSKRKGTIKMFVLEGVLNVRVTNHRFFPRWKTEF